MEESQVPHLGISSNAALKAVLNPLLAATPPANKTCFTGYCLIARNVFVTSTSTTLAWKLAARSSGLMDSPRCSALWTVLITADLRPLKLKS